MVHISRSVVNHKVMLMDEEGRYIGEWRPFSGSMVGLAAGYKLYDLSPTTSVFQTPLPRFSLDK